MGSQIDRDLEYISNVLLDIEFDDGIPLNELEQVSLAIDWDAAIGRLRRMPSVLTEQEQADLEAIKTRIRAQKKRMKVLSVTYPDFIDA